MKHIICFSGGHSSAIVALKVVKKYGKNNVILLNHNISKKVEDIDIKRFKLEISNYLDIPITYANMENWDKLNQFDVSIKAKAFKTNDTPAICTSRLKTQPFKKYLEKYHSSKDCILYYGFDKNEVDRIVRRTYIMALDDYKTEYPLAQWKDTIKSTKEIGINPPLQYNNFKHANCIGCLKGGSQHWYVVYCTRPDIWDEAKKAEKIIGYSIIKGKFLKNLECDFYRMKSLGIKPTEHVPFQKFWTNAKSVLSSPGLFNFEDFEKTCMCS